MFARFCPVGNVILFLFRREVVGVWFRCVTITSRPLEVMQQILHAGKNRKTQVKLDWGTKGPEFWPFHQRADWYATGVITPLAVCGTGVITREFSKRLQKCGYSLSGWVISW